MLERNTIYRTCEEKYPDNVQGTFLHMFLT